jgi:protein SCO1/2
VRCAIVSRVVCGLVLAWLVTGCGSKRSDLNGHVPLNLATVGHVTVPEVQVGRPDRSFALRATPGKLLIVYFGYASCPDVCPTTMADVRSALERLGADSGKIEFAFITVDPARDTSAVLAPYVASFITGGHALRPPDQQTLAVAERAFDARSSVERDLQGRVEVSHTPLTYVVNSEGRILLEWDFGTPSAQMTHDLRTLLRAGGPP